MYEACHPKVKGSKHSSGCENKNKQIHQALKNPGTPDSPLSVTVICITSTSTRSYCIDRTLSLIEHIQFQKFFHSRMEGTSSMRARLTGESPSLGATCVAPSAEEGCKMCLHCRRFFCCMICIPPLQTAHRHCLSSVYKLRCYELGTTLPEQLDFVSQ